MTAPRIGVELTPEHPTDQLADWAVTAERGGLDAVFVSHHYNNRDEFIALSAIADATSRVDLGPGITNPYETHPVTLASRMATLDEYADGRGLFGLGPGDGSTLTNLGYEQDRPLRRVLETMQTTRRLWDGERVDHDGTFSADDAGLNYDVGSIPVYVGAQGPHMTRMSAKYADGVLYNGSHPRDIAWAGDRISEGLSDRSDERGDFEFLAYASVSVAGEQANAREAARPPVAFIAASAPPPVLDRHDLDEETAGEIGDAIAAGEFTEAFEQVTPAMIDAFCLAGTPDAVADKVDAILDEADGVVFGSPLGPDVGAAVELLADRFGEE